MRRLVPLAISVLALFAPPDPVAASGDFACEPSWKLPSDSFGTCGNRAVLSPGNDTRVNMFYLLLERQGAAPAAAVYPEGEDDRTLGRSFFSWRLLRKAYDPRYDGPLGDGEFYGSRCASLASGGASFAAALAADRKVPAAERGKLVAARERLAERCRGAALTPLPAGIRSARGREFLAYVVAAEAFYGEDWDAARQGFDRLRGASDPWLAETAAYMLARVELNAAQANSFDEYGSFAGPDRTDRAALARAQAGLAAYLQRYREGRYAASARGLARRVMWLSGDTVGLARAYERLLGAVPLAGPRAGDLIEEIDNKLLMAGGGEAADGPLLLATIDLMRMRDAAESGAPTISAEALAAQEPRFAGRTELFSFVMASHAYYVAKDMRRVLQLIPDDARQPRYAPLAFSRQVLRGMALAALGDRNEAGFWRELLGGAHALYQRPLVELALAMAYERSGRLGDVFAAGSPIGESPIREILLQQVAGPELLRAQARSADRPQHERDLALFTLLYKQLTHGRYAAFVGDSALLRADAPKDGGLWDIRTQEEIPTGLFRAGVRSDGYACPALAKTAAALARDPADAGARLCLGEFYRLNGFDDLEANAARPAAEELGGTASRFPGRRVYRGRFYADIIADPRAAAGEKAYALYRAVNCYAPAGNNACGGEDVPESQRQAWFQRLKRDYPNSEWALKLRYYW
jgi:hypothetical protein